MNFIRNHVDGFLNKFTMYRVVLYSLGLLLVVSEFLASIHSIGISSTGLLISIAVLVVVCYVANRLLGLLFKVPTNQESYLITALILACIMPPSTQTKQILLIALTGLVAMLAKFLLFKRGSNAFNPAASAAFIMSLTGLLGATWWIGSPPLAPFTAVVGLLILRKVKVFSLFFAFAAAALLMMLLVSSVLHGQPVYDTTKTLFLSYPLIFLGTVMLTEPSTLPPTRFFRVLEGLVVGAIFTSQLHFHNLTSTPEAALIAGNIFALCVGAGLGAIVILKERRELAPDLYEFIFEQPKNRQLSFAAGQYAEWTLPHAKPDDRGNRRTFSIAAAPNNDELKIGVKITEQRSTFKAALLDARPGQRLRVAHVAGDFTLPADTKSPLVFIAGGIGITPFVSMLRHIANHANDHRQITLCYVASKDSDFAYDDVLRTASAHGLKVIKHVGRLDDDVVTTILEGIKTPDVYISGPPVMVQAAKALLTNHHVSLRHIHTDFFSGY